MSESSEEMVNHPKHYGGIFCTHCGEEFKDLADIIDQIALYDAHVWMILKYIHRAGKKDSSKEVEDLEKAFWYLARAILRRGGAIDKIPTDVAEILKRMA